MNKRGDTRKVHFLPNPPGDLKESNISKKLKLHGILWTKISRKSDIIHESNYFSFSLFLGIYSILKDKKKEFWNNNIT